KKNSTSSSDGADAIEYGRSVRLPSCSTPRVAYCPGRNLNSPPDWMRNFHRSGAMSTRCVIRAWKNLSSGIVMFETSRTRKRFRCQSEAGECGPVKWRDNTRQDGGLTTERSFQLPPPREALRAECQDLRNLPGRIHPAPRLRDGSPKSLCFPLAGRPAAHEALPVRPPFFSR